MQTDMLITVGYSAALPWVRARFREVPGRPSERVRYKLCMMLRRRQDGTALMAHWVPVSETASRQHL